MLLNSPPAIDGKVRESLVNPRHVWISGVHGWSAFRAIRGNADSGDRTPVLYPTTTLALYERLGAHLAGRNCRYGLRPVLRRILLRE